MPERRFSANSTYRYGFNGKENDNEVKGDGTQQDYGMRIYDPRLGRFLSVDPLTKSYPELTPYQFASNRPIDGIDQDGLEYYSNTTAERFGGRKCLYFLTAFRFDNKNLSSADVATINPELAQNITGKDPQSRLITSQGVEQFSYKPATIENTYDMQEIPDPSSEKEANRGWRNKNGNGDRATVAGGFIDFLKLAVNIGVEITDGNDIEYSRFSAVALNNAYLDVKKAASNATFPSYLANSYGFLADLTNYVASGYIPENSVHKIFSPAYQELVRMWGNLVLDGLTNFTGEQTNYHEVQRVINSDNWQYSYRIQVKTSSTNQKLHEALNQTETYKKENGQVETDKTVMQESNN